jgi:[calcium/calmodulin-dependent protein kinase] kinase
MKKINKKELAKKRKGFTTDENGNLVVNNLLQDAMKEIAILKKLKHKNIIRLVEIMTDEEKCKTYISTINQ